MNVKTEAKRLQKRLDTIDKAFAKGLECEKKRHATKLLELTNKTSKAVGNARAVVSDAVLAELDGAAPTENVTDDETDFDA